MELASNELNAISQMAPRLLINLAALTMIVRVIYFCRGGKRDFLFTFMMVGIVIFFLSFILNHIKLELGLALGLFAIFGIIRYRTTQIPIREMTYLFLVTGVSIINAMASEIVGYKIVGIVNLIIIFVLFVLERYIVGRKVHTKEVVYEKIELISPDRRQEMIDDLNKRTGLEIVKIDIENIDFLKDIANITIYYNSQGTV